MNTITALKPAALYRQCALKQFTFKTTAELEDLTEMIGQARAVEAIKFGISIHHEGYNLYALGPHSTGKHSSVRQYLEQRAAQEALPDDWCYVNNFQQPHRPRTLRLSPGQGRVLKDDMEQLVAELRDVIPAAFESEDYRARMQAIENQIKMKQEAVFQKIQQQAKSKGLALLQTPTGLAFAPIKKGKVVSQEEFENIAEDERKRLEAEVEILQNTLSKAVYQARQLEKESREQIKSLNHEVAGMAVNHLIDDLQKKYKNLPAVTDYLKAVQQDVVENVDDFRPSGEAESAPMEGLPLPRALQGPAFLRRYQVNVLVDHSKSKGAPVVYEDRPAYKNLVGRIEHIMSHTGVLMTDFTMLKAGALHAANGGYLILDALKILLQPYAWEELKRTLRSKEIKMESPEQVYGLISTISLQPEPIPLDIKIILIGDRYLYYLLSQQDPDFQELFKVAADFAEDMPRNSDSALLYARLIGTLARKEGLRHFDRSAVARVIEHSARMVSDAEKLSIRMQGVTDLIREADYWANQADHLIVSANDVQQAIDAQIHRASRLRDSIQEEIERGTILIDTDGKKIGQINGLSVISLGNFSFGRPSRITARVRLGKGEVIDIERQVELGGPLHSKGMFILSGFLGARYAANHPLSLTASIVFEQSYGGVDGDSASSAELYALISALAETPIKQSLAVTGSVNQHGQVQAIGGVNEKIEGYFDICRARGLTGEQGVLIPASNVKHLMLRQDVIDAVAAGKFHVYPVEHIDQGIEILTGLPAGERDADGNFPPGSVNALVEARLTGFIHQWQAFNKPNG